MQTVNFIYKILKLILHILQPSAKSIFYLCFVQQKRGRAKTANILFGFVMDLLFQHYSIMNIYFENVFDNLLSVRFRRAISEQ